jgi:hypothetical protein
MTDHTLLLRAASLITDVAERLDELGAELGGACDSQQRALAAQELDLQRQLLLATAEVLREDDPALRQIRAQSLPLEEARAKLCGDVVVPQSKEMEFF